MSLIFELRPDGTYVQIDDPPKPADMVSVVRCRNCKHYVDASCYVDKELHDCRYWGDWTTSNGFCAWGERRDA